MPVNADTLFGLGSVSKTFTATALMRLVADGRAELDAPVRRYLPELVLKDERTAATRHRPEPAQPHAGLDWGLVLDTGEGDDALARYVEHLPELELVAPPGARTSYSQAAYNLVGRIIEKLTNQTFEQAVGKLVS